MSIAMEKVRTMKTKTIMAYKLAKYKWQGGNFKHDISTYLIFVIFFTHAKLLENKIYTEKRVNYNGFCDKIA